MTRRARRQRRRAAEYKMALPVVGFVGTGADFTALCEFLEDADWEPGLVIEEAIADYSKDGCCAHLSLQSRCDNNRYYQLIAVMTDDEELRIALALMHDLVDWD